MTPLFPAECIYALSAKEVIARLGSDLQRVLSAAETKALFVRYGSSTFPIAPLVPSRRRALAQFESPLAWLLIAARAISPYVWTLEGGRRAPYKALSLLAIAIANANY